MAKRLKSTKDSYTFPSRIGTLAADLSKLYFRPEPNPVVPGQIVTIDKFFSTDICNELITSFVSGLNLETTPLIKSKDYAARYNDRCSVTDTGLAANLWEYLKSILLYKDEYDDDNDMYETFKDAKGLNPQLRIYRYEKGHHFGKHYDESVKCSVPGNSKSGTTKWTLLIYLTGGEEFSGGDTIFYPDFGGRPLSVHPSKGMALLHKHGDDCLMHEAQLVSLGTKWVLRSDVAF